MSNKILLIGINYKGTSSELSGCINDVNNMYRHLKRSYEVDPNNVHILTDDTPKKPTRRNIIKEIKWLVSSCHPSDSLFFHYSGHGSYVRDTDDEDDGRDETLVPLDYQSKGLIIDDDLRKLMITGLPHGVKLFCIFDSCHSGTVLDLRYKHEYISSTFRTSKQYQYPNTLGTVITVSGCRDLEFSSDSKEENVETGKYQYQGALTHTFLKLMKRYKNDISLKNLILQLNIDLQRDGYKQRPVLCTGSKMNLNQKCNLLGKRKNKQPEICKNFSNNQNKKCVLI